jgi:hypothetical protein
VLFNILENMSVVYMNETVSLLFSRENKTKIEELINSGEVKVIEREGKEPIKYLKIEE